jgi:hypothetical protein
MSELGPRAGPSRRYSLSLQGARPTGPGCLSPHNRSLACGGCAAAPESGSLSRPGECASSIAVAQARPDDSVGDDHADWATEELLPPTTVSDQAGDEQYLDERRNQRHLEERVAVPQQATATHVGGRVERTSAWCRCRYAGRIFSGPLRRSRAGRGSGAAFPPVRPSRAFSRAARCSRHLPRE